MELPSKMSTKQVRFEQSDLAAFLLEKLKRGILAGTMETFAQGNPSCPPQSYPPSNKGSIRNCLFLRGVALGGG